MPIKDKAKRAEYSKQWKQQHKALGLCRDCTRPAAISSKKYCLYHLDVRHRSDKRLRLIPARREYLLTYCRVRYYRLKDENKCPSCGMPLNEESHIGIYCLNCQDKKASYG